MKKNLLIAIALLGVCIMPLSNALASLDVKSNDNATAPAASADKSTDKSTDKSADKSTDKSTDNKGSAKDNKNATNSNAAGAGQTANKSKDGERTIQQGNTRITAGQKTNEDGSVTKYRRTSAGTSSSTTTHKDGTVVQEDSFTAYGSTFSKKVTTRPDGTKTEVITRGNRQTTTNYDKNGKQVGEAETKTVEKNNSTGTPNSNTNAGTATPDSDTTTGGTTPDSDTNAGGATPDSDTNDDDDQLTASIDRLNTGTYSIFNQVRANLIKGDRAVASRGQVGNSSATFGEGKEPVVRLKVGDTKQGVGTNAKRVLAVGDTTQGLGGNAQRTGVQRHMMALDTEIQLLSMFGYHWWTMDYGMLRSYMLRPYEFGHLSYHSAMGDTMGEFSGAERNYNRIVGTANRALGTLGKISNFLTAY